MKCHDCGEEFSPLQPVVFCLRCQIKRDGAELNRQYNEFKKLLPSNFFDACYGDDYEDKNR